MSLSHDGFTFFGHSHDVLVAEPYDLALVPGQFFGVAGEGHIVGERYGRLLRCRVHFDGYASQNALKTDLDTLKTRIGRLTGTLTADGQSYTKTTFIGFAPDPNGPFFDGSGVHDWVQFVTLLWRQRT